MNEDKASAPLRLIIRATIGGTGDGASLRNVITDIYPDGALCFVLENRALYQLNKGSTATADNSTVLQPIGGPGRWFLLGQSAGATTLAAIVGTANNNVDSSGSANFVAVAGSAFAFQPSGTPVGFALTALGGVLTYSGLETVRARLTLTGSVYAATGLGGTMWGAVAVNGDVLGTDPTTSFLTGTQSTEVGGAGLPQVISVQRTVLLAPGDTVQMAFATDLGVDLTLTRATLSVQL